MQQVQNFEEWRISINGAAGVSMRTFSRWLSQNTLLLAELGVMPTTKLIPARAAHWICGQYGIDEGEL
ncbi:MAG: hypothetical protein J5661_01405 [Bacteroidaceae bacterium]|nr:hypothetical protein [Bacteroidaceae bacterium]